MSTIRVISSPLDLTRTPYGFPVACTRRGHRGCSAGHGNGRSPESGAGSRRTAAGQGRAPLRQGSAGCPTRPVPRSSVAVCGGHGSDGERLGHPGASYHRRGRARTLPAASLLAGQPVTGATTDVDRPVTPRPSPRAGGPVGTTMSTSANQRHCHRRRGRAGVLPAATSPCSVSNEHGGGERGGSFS